jgi:hypothetical protein
VDSCVFANWVIVSGRLREIEEKDATEKKRKEELKSVMSKYRKAKESYDFLEKTILDKQNEYYTSDLAVVEVYSTIFEIVLTAKMTSEGYPPRLWGSVKGKFDLTVAEGRRLIAEIHRMMSYFFRSKNRISLLQSKRIKLSHPAYLITNYKCDTHDAVLLSTSYTNGCKIFVTIDERLKKALRGYDKVKIVYPIDMIKHFGAYHKLLR